jgi:hypothetical protein
MDSQSVKIGDQSGVRGYDAGRKVTDRKRHNPVDVILKTAVEQKQTKEWILISRTTNSRLEHEFQPLTAMVNGEKGHYSPQVLAFVSLVLFCIHVKWFF